MFRSKGLNRETTLPNYSYTFVFLVWVCESASSFLQLYTTDIEILQSSKHPCLCGCQKQVIKYYFGVFLYLAFKPVCTHKVFQCFDFFFEVCSFSHFLMPVFNDLSWDMLSCDALFIPIILIYQFTFLLLNCLFLGGHYHTSCIYYCDNILAPFCHFCEIILII